MTRSRFVMILVMQMFSLGAVVSAAPLASQSLILVHTSRHYHSDLETISATQRLIDRFFLQHRAVVALAQEDPGQDPLWYGYSDHRISRVVRSIAGQHDLYPRSIPSRSFEVTFVGGYHSACLGWAMAELIARFVKSSNLMMLEINLPTAGIFTGFVRSKLAPYFLTPSVAWEAQADSSLDGLNLHQATAAMSDEVWASFMAESLRWAIFIKAPILESPMSSVEIQVFRGEKALLTYPTGTTDKRKHIILRYL